MRAPEHPCNRWFPAIVMATFLASAYAADDSSQPKPAWAQQREDSARLRQEANAQRDAADAKLAAQSAVCYRKFFVNSCLDKAKVEHTAAIIEARKQRLESSRMQRDANRQEREERLALAAQREAERGGQAVRGREEFDTRVKEAAQRDADFARRQEQTKAKAAAQARRQAQRDAEKAEARARTEAQARQRAEKQRQKEEERSRQQ